jgi:hypothetical protein
MTDSEFAKTHLRDHLASLLIPPIAEGFWSIHTSAKELCERNGQNDQILRTFQNMLTKIPEWSDLTLSTEVQRIEKVTKCTYLDDLIMGVFISYMKSFASLQYQNNSNQIEIEFDKPSLAKFIHEMYIHSARKLWQTAYLLNTNVTTEVQARNRQEVERCISQCLEQVIRGFLPWQAITKKYFNNTEPPAIETDDESDTESEPEPTKTVTFEEPDPPKLTLSEENAVLDVPEETPEEKVDVTNELTKKVEETLVLNL